MDTAHNNQDGQPLSPTFIGVICGLFLAPTALGFSAAPVALSTLAHHLHVSAGQSAWVLAAYTLTMAVMTALSGRIADLRGLRTPLPLVTIALAVGTAVCLIAPNLSTVIIGRLIQGIGAGAASVIAFRLPATRLAKPGDRGTALGTMGIIVGLLSGAGALLGGILTQDLSWRWALALPGLSILSVPAIALMVPSVDTRHANPLDIRGALLCTVAVAALTVLIQAHSTGLQWPQAALAGLIMTATAMLLARHQHQHPDGFIPRALSANPRFRLAAASGFTLFAGYLVMQFAAPLLLIAHDPRLSTTDIGFILLPAGLTSAALSRTAGALIVHTGAWPIVLALSAASTTGLLVAAAIGTSPVAIVIALAACVSGFSAGQVTLMAALPAIVETDIQGVATGVFQLIFITGGSIGAAAIGALSTLVDLRLGVALLAVLPAVGFACAALAARSTPTRSSTADNPKANERIRPTALEPRRG